MCFPREVHKLPHNTCVFQLETSTDVTLVLLKAQRSNIGFTKVLLRVNEQALVLQWCCLGSSEKNICVTFVLFRIKRTSDGFTQVLFRVKRNSNGFTLVLLRVQRTTLVLHWFCLGLKEK